MALCALYVFVRLYNKSPINMTRTHGKTLGILAIISVACLVFLLFLFLITSYGLNIQRITLSKTLFDNPTLEYNYDFGNLSNNIIYNIKVRLVKKPDLDYREVFEQRRNFEIKALLRDSTNIILVNNDINKYSKIPSSWGRSEIDFTVARFEAKSKKNYHLSLVFNNSDHFFYLFQKNANEIFLEEDYDYAAVPWIKAIHSISTLLLAASFLSATITITILVRKKNKGTNDCVDSD